MPEIFFAAASKVSSRLMVVGIETLPLMHQIYIN